MDSGNKVLKRHLVHGSEVEYPVATRKILGADFLEEIPLERLDAHSCETEAFEFGHEHHSALLMHQLCCEMRKFVHYMRIIGRNCKSELTLGPLVTEEKYDGDVLGTFYRHTPQLLEAVIKEPHHLLILPEIIRDAVPFPSICEALHRIRVALFKVLHFGHSLIKIHLHHLLEYFFFHHNLGLDLLRILHDMGKMHILEFFGFVLPAAEDLIKEKVLPLTEDCDDEQYVPEYKKSFEEVVACFRGAHDGYYASGIHDLFKSGIKTFASSTTTSAVSSFLSTIPFVDNFAPYLDNGLADVSPVEVGPVVSPIYERIAPIVEYLRPLFSPLALGPVVTPMETYAPVETETVSKSVTSASVDVVEPVEEYPVEGLAYSPVDCEPLNEVVVPVKEEAVSTTASVSTVDVGNSLAAETVTASVANVLPGVSTPVVASPVVTPLLGYNTALGVGSPLVTSPVISPLTSYGSLLNPVASFYPGNQLVSPMINPVLGNSVINPLMGYNTLVNPVASVYAPQAISSLTNAAIATAAVETEPLIAARPVSEVVVEDVSDTVSQTSSTVVESMPAVVERIPEVVDCGSVPVVASGAVEDTVRTTTTETAAEDIVAIPVNARPYGLVSGYKPGFAPVSAIGAVEKDVRTTAIEDVATVNNGPFLVSGYRPGLASVAATTRDRLVEPLPFARYGLPYPEYPMYPVESAAYRPLVPSVALSSAMGITDVSRTTVLSRQEFSFVLDREKIIDVLGSDCITPGDVVSVTLRNKAVLYGSVLDAESPIRFSFLRPRLYGGLLHKGARVWNILHSDFKDSECTEIFNDPVLLSY